jgi:thioredoxin 2
VTGGKPRCGKCQTLLPWLVDATSETFDAAIAESSVPILVDLWAPWCGPCKMIAPALEQLSRDRVGDLRVLKLNIDEAPQVASKLGVQSIPTIVLFDKGVEVARQVGAVPAGAISRWLDAAGTA